MAVQSSKRPSVKEKPSSGDASDDEIDAKAPLSLQTLLANKARDSCRCVCSTSGCTFLSSSWKGYEYLQYWIGSEYKRVVCEESCRIRLESVAGITKDVANDGNNRWLVTQFIRLTIFSYLGIRHTCCDISWIVRGNHNFFRPRYPPRETRRIQDEDRYLTDLFEQLVEELDKEYDTFGGDLTTFYDERLMPRLNSELDRLKEEDAQFTQGRRELGVRMEMVSSDDDGEDENSGQDSDEHESGEEVDDGDPYDLDD